MDTAMTGDPMESDLCDRLLLALLREAESGVVKNEEPKREASWTPDSGISDSGTPDSGTPDSGTSARVRKPITRFPRGLRLLSRHPRASELSAAIVTPPGLVKDLLYAELSALESRVPIASNYPDRSASAVAGLAYHLRRLRALRGVAAVAELRALPAFWRSVLLLDPDAAQEFIDRLGRSIELVRSLDRPIEPRSRIGVASALSEPVSPGLEDAIVPCLETLRPRFDPFSARGLAMLAIIWHQGSAAGADRAALVGRSDLGVIVSRLRPCPVSADDYGQVARLARKHLLRVAPDANSFEGEVPVIMTE